MTTELFFIYDSHCPWSYAATTLVTNIHQQFPDMPINLWHCAHYCGDTDSKVSAQQIDAVKQTSKAMFSNEYLAQVDNVIDSTMAANLLAWANQQSTDTALKLLDAFQQAHFVGGQTLADDTEVSHLLDKLKLSPPKKALTLDKLTKTAEHDIQEIISMQEFIDTQALPALLLAVDDNLILLNHNLYLDNPEAIIDAIKMELGQ